MSLRSRPKRCATMLISRRRGPLSGCCRFRARRRFFQRPAPCGAASPRSSRRPAARCGANSTPRRSYISRNWSRTSSYERPSHSPKSTSRSSGTAVPRHSGDGERGRLDGARHAARVERVELYPSAQMPAERRRRGAPLRGEREVRPPVINAAPKRELRLRVAHEIYTFALSHFIGSFCRFVFYDEPIVSFRCGIFVRRKLRRSAGPRFAVSVRFSLCGAPRRFAPLSGAELDAFVARL